MSKSKRTVVQNSDPEAIKPVAEAGLPAREVELALVCLGARHVYVCGDFNEWQPTTLRMVETPGAGLWRKRLQLRPGRYQYKFVVDGKWLHDPEAYENVCNRHGSLNSVLEVQP